MADLIVVLDGARVAEVGTHDELMARGGSYADLYGSQAAAYRGPPEEALMNDSSLGEARKCWNLLADEHPFTEGCCPTEGAGAIRVTAGCVTCSAGHAQGHRSVRRS